MPSLLERLPAAALCPRAELAVLLTGSAAAPTSAASAGVPNPVNMLRTIEAVKAPDMTLSFNVVRTDIKHSSLTRCVSGFWEKGIVPTFPLYRIAYYAIS